MATTLPFWPWRHSQFRHFPLTTLQTQVSLVSIGHRIRSLSAFWLADWGLCQWASHPQQCHCWTQATLSSYHCLNMALHEQHFLPLEGAQLLTDPAAFLSWVQGVVFESTYKLQPHPGQISYFDLDAQRLRKYQGSAVTTSTEPTPSIPTTPHLFKQIRTMYSSG